MGRYRCLRILSFCNYAVLTLCYFFCRFFPSMTDGRDFHKMLLYFYRGGVNRNRPALIANHLGTRFLVQRSEASKQLEQRGLAAFFSDPKIYEEAEAAVPDSLGKTAEEIQAMPKFVRNYRCGNLIEKGDPYCHEEKYNNTYCAKRRFKTSWHQGWWVFSSLIFPLALVVPF